jgi:hypothetical protein
MKTKLKSTKKPNPHARHIVVTFKANADEMHQIMKWAHYYCAGNVSEFVRWAATNPKPAKGDFKK